MTDQDRAPTGPVTASVASSTAWNILQYGGGKAVTLVSTVILARLLAPESFGLVASAVLAVSVFDRFKDLGVGPALVQNQRDWDDLAPTGLTLTVASSFAFGGLSLLLAPQLAAFLGNDALTPIIRGLAVSLLISGFAVFPDSALRRYLRFREKVVPELSGILVKAILSVGLALQGFGAWSLVWGQLGASVTTTTAYWIVYSRATHDAPHFGWKPEVSRRLLSFGGWMSGLAIMSVFLDNLDYFVIGRRLGAVELGYYTMGFRLPELVVLGTCLVIGQVLFSSFSRQFADQEEMASTYRRATELVTALTVPAGLGLSAAAKPIVLLMLGAAYEPSVGVLRILGVYSAVFSISFMTGEVFKSLGKTAMMIRLATAQLTVMIPIFWLAAGHSIFAVAGAFLAVGTGNTLIRLTLVQRYLRMSLARQLTLLAPAVSSGIIMWLAVLAVDTGLASTPLWVRLVAAVATGVVCYAAFLRLTGPAVFARLAGFVLRRGGSRSFT